MPRRHFDDWLQAYIDFASEGSEAPLRFHFWTGVSVLAGALRGKVWRDEIKFRWTPNFYIVLVAPPGIATKSTTMNIGMSLLEEIDDVVFGPDSATWQAVLKGLAEAGQEYTYFDPITRTEEKLNLSCMTIAVSELGTFLKVQAEGFVDIMIDMWDGQVKKKPWKHSTATTGKTEITNPWLNMIACTTPSWLQSNFPQHMIGGGLTSRIVFVYADQKRQFIPYPSQHWNPLDHRTLRNKLLDDLRSIAVLRGPYEMTAAAVTYGTEWYARINAPGGRSPLLSSDRFDSYFSRKQVFLHKLAIVKAAASRDELVIQANDLKWAEHLLSKSVEEDLLKVFESVGLVDQARQTREIEKRIQLGPIAIGTLFNSVSSFMSQKDFEAAITASVIAGRSKIIQYPIGEGKTERRLASFNYQPGKPNEPAPLQSHPPHHKGAGSPPPEVDPSD